MKRFLLLPALVAALFGAGIFSSHASELALSARSAILVDAESFAVLYEKNADERLPMASTTKIITTVTAIINGNSEDTVTVSANAAGTEGSSVYLKAGEKISLSELLFALMLESGNDAAVAVAEHISGSVEEFAALMNETVKKIGAVNTNCITVNGLDAPGHYTTARDLALITRYALKLELFRELVSTQEKSVSLSGVPGGRTLINHNKLLKSYEGATGVKTGYTKKSGRCLVSSAKRDGLEAIAVTLNAPDDWNDHKKLLDYSFESFRERTSVLEKGKIIGKIRVDGFNDGFLPYAPEDDLKLRVPEAEIKIRYNIGKLSAPVADRAIVGSADIYADGHYVKSVNLLACGDAPENDVCRKLKTRYIFLLKILFDFVRDG